MDRHFPEDECIALFETSQISNYLAIVELIVQYSGTISANKTLNFPIEDN